MEYFSTLAWRIYEATEDVLWSGFWLGSSLGRLVKILWQAELHWVRLVRKYPCTKFVLVILDRWIWNRWPKLSYVQPYTYTENVYFVRFKTQKMSRIPNWTIEEEIVYFREQFFFKPFRDNRGKVLLGGQKNVKNVVSIQILTVSTSSRLVSPF